MKIIQHVILRPAAAGRKDLMLFRKWDGTDSSCETVQDSYVASLLRMTWNIYFQSNNPVDRLFPAWMMQELTL